MTRINQTQAVTTPTLNEFESTAEAQGQVEKLSVREYEIFAQLLRYPEQTVRRDSLKRVIGIDDDSLSDRRLDALMSALIRKANVLCPAFPVVRFVEPDSYIYTEQPPRRRGS